MEKVTEADIAMILDAAKEEGLPVGSVVCADLTFTMLVDDRAAVEQWAEHIDQPVVEDAGKISTSFAEHGYAFHVVTPI